MVTDFESAGIALTVVYFLSTLPVWIFQHKIQYWDIRSMCTLEWLCPNFVLSNLPIRRSASQITHHQTNIPRSRNRYIVTAHYCFFFKFVSRANNSDTLESGIDVGPTVINLAFFSRPYGLIKGPMFTNFWNFF